MTVPEIVMELSAGYILGIRNGCARLLARREWQGDTPDLVITMEDATEVIKSTLVSKMTRFANDDTMGWKDTSLDGTLWELYILKGLDCAQTLWIDRR